MLIKDQWADMIMHLHVMLQISDSGEKKQLPNNFLVS